MFGIVVVVFHKPNNIDAIPKPKYPASRLNIYDLTSLLFKVGSINSL